MSSDKPFVDDESLVSSHLPENSSSDSNLTSEVTKSDKNLPNGPYDKTQDSNSSLETESSNVDNLTALNPYEEWQQKFNERIEKLKQKELEEIENRIKVAAAELEQWHKDRKKEIDEKLKKYLEEEPSQESTKDTEFDWVTASKYLETSEFYTKDRSNGQNQKLIELIMKKKQISEKKASTNK